MYCDLSGASHPLPQYFFFLPVIVLHIVIILLTDHSYWQLGCQWATCWDCGSKFWFCKMAADSTPTGNYFGSAATQDSRAPSLPVDRRPSIRAGKTLVGVGRGQNWAGRGHYREGMLWEGNGTRQIPSSSFSEDSLTLFSPDLHKQFCWHRFEGTHCRAGGLQRCKGIPLSPLMLPNPFLPPPPLGTACPFSVQVCLRERGK